MHFPRFNAPSVKRMFNSKRVAGTVQDLPIILNVQLWFDSLDPLNTGILPANNTALPTWFDRSANAYQATQPTVGKQPVFLLNDGGTPSISATAASSQYYSVSSMINFSSTTTMVTVCGISSVPAYLNGSSNVGNAPAFIYGSAANTFEFYNNTDRHSFAVTLGGTHILGVTQTDTVNTKGYYDLTGTTPFQIFNYTPGVNVGGQHLIYLFTSNNSADFYNGKMKAFLLFNYILSASQLSQLFVFLKARYNSV